MNLAIFINKKPIFIINKDKIQDNKYNLYKKLMSLLSNKNMYSKDLNNFDFDLKSLKAFYKRNYLLNLNFLHINNKHLSKKFLNIYLEYTILSHISFNLLLINHFCKNILLKNVNELALITIINKFN